MALEPAMKGPRSRLAASAGAFVCLLLGSATLLAGFWTQFRGERAITDPSELRVVLPLLAAAGVAGLISFLRRERDRVLAVAGLAMAAAAPLLGWVVLVGLVAAGAALVMLVVAKFT
jgi:hypothetical protein